MISALLYFAVAYLLLISLVMGLNLHDFKPLPKVDNTSRHERPTVSICIPARNEEHNIEGSVLSSLEQKYGEFEVIVLDDESTDRTSKILKRIKQSYPEYLKIIDGKQKPDSWLGKSWACHQLSEKASGDILFFIDADVQLQPQAVAKTVIAVQLFSVDFITLWPIQKVETFWEKVVIPIIYYGLLGLLPARYVHHKPKWLPQSMAQRLSPVFAAACGQCMIFKRSSYKAIGGHASVKNDIVEDVALAKQIKRNGFSMRMFHGKEAACCRMYRSAAEMWQGFRKNFLGLFNNSIPAFLLMSAINFAVYVLPLFTLAAGIWQSNHGFILLSAAALLLMLVHRIVLAQWYNLQIRVAFLHPLGVLWFHALGVTALKDYVKGTRAKWKNRPTT